MRNEEKDKNSMTIMGIVIYGLIMLSLILIYKDLLITVTCVVIMLAIIVLYVALRVRERKTHQTNTDAPVGETLIEKKDGDG